MPAWLVPEAKRRWRRLAPELAWLGLLTVIDGDALATCCQAWGGILPRDRVAADGRPNVQGRISGAGLGDNGQPSPATEPNGRGLYNRCSGG